MKKVAVILADGYEESEAVTLIDVLRRGDIKSVVVGYDGINVIGAHGIKIVADTDFSEFKVSDFDMILLPGGFKNNEILSKSEKFHKILREFDDKKLKIGAICAAPWVLGSAGVLKNSYTCYPGFEKKINLAGFAGDKSNVVRDENVMTSRGPATAMEFALAIVKDLAGENVYNEVKAGLLFK